MKVHHRSINKDRSGLIKFTTEEPEDLWHIFNIINKNDTLRENGLTSLVWNISKSSLHVVKTQ